MRRKTRDEEAAAAAYYEALQNDPDAWSAPVPPPAGSHPKGVGSAVTVRFPVEEAAILRGIAAEEGRTHSDVIRRAVRAYAQHRSELREEPGQPDVMGSNGNCITIVIAHDEAARIARIVMVPTVATVA